MFVQQFNGGVITLYYQLFGVSYFLFLSLYSFFIFKSLFLRLNLIDKKCSTV